MPITASYVTPLLMVYDMRRSVAFYRDVLGFEVVQTWQPDGRLYWAMLKLGDAAVMLNAEFEDDQRPPTPPPRREPGHGLILYFGCADVDEAYGHLRANGCEVASPQTAHYGMKQVFVSDPDGFELCFQQRVGA
jgi:catechol 2,3-dioxygenase-like lactoylglutathione lyase family enzyme